MPNFTLVVRDLQKQREQLQDQIGKLDTAINTISALNGRGRGGRRNLSAAARRRIAAAQKARWAKWKKAHKAA
jgi:prefoldin subunit 5